MPRYAQRDRYQVGDYWLGQRIQDGTPAWYRMWWDKEAGRSRRASLRTSCFEEAKSRLNQWFILQAQPKGNTLADFTLAEIFPRYFDQHARSLRSADDSRRALKYWLDFHTTATLEQALHPIRQQEFHKWLRDERGLSPNSVRRILSVGKAGLNWSWKRNEIPALPHIQLVKAGRVDPKGRPLDVKEIVRLFEASTAPHTSVFMAFMLGTASRPGATLDLKYNQIDTRNNLIDLSPPGRAQTKKYRPKVRLPSQLKDFVVQTNENISDQSVVAFRGVGVASVKRSWESTRANANLPGKVTGYSFRHTVARWLRQQSVPAWSVASQLGHKAPGFETSEIYAPFDPNHLKEACSAIDLLLETVARQLRASNMSEVLLKFR